MLLPDRSQAGEASSGDHSTDRSVRSGLGEQVRTGSGEQVKTGSGEQVKTRSGEQTGTGSGGWTNNLHVAALVFGGESTILIALRLLSVAKANPETAYGILQAGGTTNVIIGTVLSLIPSIALIGASYLAVGRIWAKFPDSKFPDSSKPTQAEELGIWTSICALVLIAVLTIPFRYWEVPAIVVSVLILARIFRDSIESQEEPVGAAGRQGGRRDHRRLAPARGHHQSAMDARGAAHVH
jgi:hypothetical protein